MLELECEHSAVVGLEFRIQEVQEGCLVNFRFLFGGLYAQFLIFAQLFVFALL